MFLKNAHICVLVLTCAVVINGTVRAEEEKHEHNKRPYIVWIINKADEMGLNLTDDQKKKLDALSTSSAPHPQLKEKITAMLSKEQLDKMTDFMKRFEEKARAEKNNNHNNSEDNDDHK